MRAADSLPFRSDSIDAILLPHTLELVEDPYAVLREAERVLCGEGCLMICGFNPFSGWGARRVFAQYFRPPGISAAHAAHALRAPAARLGGAAWASMWTSVYGYLGSLPDDAPSAQGARWIIRADTGRAPPSRRAGTCSKRASACNADLGAPETLGAPARAGAGGEADHQSRHQ